MAFEGNKTCIMNKLKAVSCPDYDSVNVALVAYADLLTAYYVHSSTFDCNPDYARLLFDCVDGAELALLEIHYDENMDDANPALVITNPSLVMDVHASEIVLDGPDELAELSITGDSVIGKITIAAGKVVNILTVGGGAYVGPITMGAGAKINYLRVIACKENKSTLEGYTAGTVTDARIDEYEGAVYGGLICAIPVGACASPVTSLDADRITLNAIRLGWLVPGDSLFVKIRYRLSGTGRWFEVRPDITSGNFETVDGKKYFTFRDLAETAYYDFEVYNVCENGQYSLPAIKTVRTGAQDASCPAVVITTLPPKPIMFTIGDAGELTPAAGSTSYVNPDLAGYDITVGVTGMPFLTEGVHFSRSLDGQTINLLPDTEGNQRRFEDGETWRIELYKL